MAYSEEEKDDEGGWWEGRAGGIWVSGQPLGDVGDVRGRLISSSALECRLGGVGL